MHLIGIAVDITEQKTLVERTAAADIRLRDAIETIPEAFVLWDHDNRLVLCNSNFQKLHNLPDEAITSGTPYEDVVAAGPQARHALQARERRPDHPGARTFEAQLDDGRWLHISERRTKDGGYVSVGTDITATQAARRPSWSTASSACCATVTDLRKQPAQARNPGQAAGRASRSKYAEEKTRAEEANQAKSKFLGQHEPRAAHAAQRHHRLLRDHGVGACSARSAPTSIAEYCRDIHASGQYLLDVINDVLDMSKIEAGRLKLDLEQVELARELDDALRVITTRAEAKSLTVTSKIAHGREAEGRPPRAEADRAQSAVQRGEIHRRRTAGSRCAAGCRAARWSSASRIPASASRPMR